MWKAWVFYPVVRAAKRLLSGRATPLPPGTGRIHATAFSEFPGGAGLEPEEVEYASYLPVLSPLDALFPHTATAFAEHLEGATRLRRVLATQVVFAARKRP